jgi:Na+/proline symporter
MITAMGLLLMVATANLGGITSAYSQMQAVDGFTHLVPKDLVFPGWRGGALFIISWLFAGLSVIGQPQIMVRFMTLNDAENMKSAKLWYYLWFSAF